MIIGLTGNIGSGKSTAVHILATCGAAVIDADKVGHGVLRIGGAAYADVVAEFGREFLTAQGEIDRKRLGAYVFADVSGERLRRLNELTHPAITAVLREWVHTRQQEGARMIVIEAALLFDSPLCELTEENWLITADRDVLLRRIVDRDGCSIEAAEQRLSSQRSEVELRELADRVFENNGDSDELAQKLQRAYAEVEKA